MALITGHHRFLRHAGSSLRRTTTAAVRRHPGRYHGFAPEPPPYSGHETLFSRPYSYIGRSIHQSTAPPCKTLQLATFISRPIHTIRAACIRSNRHSFWIHSLTALRFLVYRPTILPLTPRIRPPAATRSSLCVPIRPHSKLHRSVEIVTFTLRGYDANFNQPAGYQQTASRRRHSAGSFASHEAWRGRSGLTT